MENYLDDISFIEEPAQTYTYDPEGNVMSVESSGNGEDEYGYDLEMEDIIEVTTVWACSPVSLWRGEGKWICFTLGK